MNCRTSLGLLPFSLSNLMAKMRSFSSGAVLGDGLGTLGDGVLGELSGEDESDGSLDLSGRDGRSVVVRCELGFFAGDSLKDIRDERVEDSHGLVAGISGWVS